MVDPLDVASIELDNEIYLHEKIIIKNHEGRVIKIINPKPGKAEDAFKKVVSNWIKAVNELEKNYDEK